MFDALVRVLQILPVEKRALLLVDKSWGVQSRVAYEYNLTGIAPKERLHLAAGGSPQSRCFS